ncbi:hypothetical protein LXA43DRAFT_1131757 [Ganoderma leucocontextum]|nr:hypothetical protein LXA43DRAFT_1131757 [Ganoderma leucocontextum]
MQFLCLLASFASAFLIPTTTVSARNNVLPPPQFEPLFVATLSIQSIQNLTGPLGTRVHSVTGVGNLTNATTGELVGTILENHDNGIIGEDIFFSSVVLPVIWAVDQKFASISATGVGISGETSMSYLHLETDSPTWSSLNGRFLISTLSFTGSDQTSSTIYGEVLDHY